MSEHILLTGGTGFVGRSLIPKLLLGGHTVTVLTRQ
ncbi:NAD-dependent epimerase/dehydratase family protein, partial [Litorivivens sp.]